MNWRKPIIFAGLYLTGSKIPAYLKEIKSNEFFKEKIKKYFGIFGLIALRIFNPDSFPPFLYFLRTKFFIIAIRR